MSFIKFDNAQLLEDVISGSGMKKSFIAERLGLSHQTLRNKILGVSGWSTLERREFCAVLGVEEDDLFWEEGE